MIVKDTLTIKLIAYFVLLIIFVACIVNIGLLLFGLDHRMWFSPSMSGVGMVVTWVIMDKITKSI